MHGMTYINEIIHNELKDNNKYFIQKINLTKDINETGARNFQKLFRNLLIIINTWKAMINTPSETVYLPLTQSKLGIIRDLLLLLPFLNKKKYFHIHGFTILKTWHQSIIFRLVLKILTRKSELIVLCDEHLRQMKKITKMPLHILPNCLNNQESRKGKLKLASKVRILYLSNVSKNKGIFELIDILEDNKNLHLTIAGSIMDSKDELFKRIDYLSNQCKYIGFANEEQKKILFETHDIFMLLSKMDEGAPISIIESLKFGVPVIASKKGCIPNMIENAGYVIKDPSDKLDLLRGIEYVMDDYVAISNSALQIFKQYYSKSVFIKNFKNILTNGS